MWIDDQIIKNCQKALTYEVWSPSETLVVLGRSNKIELEVDSGACEREGISILRRYGGGGTVVLYPGCLIVSVGAWVSSQYDNDKYFISLNQAIIDTIQIQSPGVELVQKGYSDIVCGAKKIAGTSLFRSRHYLLYQASIIIDMDLEKIEKFLQHPSREPDYRMGRPHRDFLTSLASATGLSLTPQQWADHFQLNFEAALRHRLEDEVREPQWEHIRHLLLRAQG